MENLGIGLQYSSFHKLISTVAYLEVLKQLAAGHRLPVDALQHKVVGIQQPRYQRTQVLLEVVVDCWKIAHKTSLTAPTTYCPTGRGSAG